MEKAGGRVTAKAYRVSLGVMNVLKLTGALVVPICEYATELHI